MATSDLERPEDPKPRNQKKWAAGAGLLVLLTKFKAAAFFLLKAGKPLWTMLLSVGAYALIAPWAFAIGLVLLLFVHEMGHVWAARRKGLPVTAPVFIPFLGALIMMKRNPKDAATEAYISMGGPLLGTVGAFVCYAGGLWTGEGIWYSLAYAGFLLNLLNLMPVHPLDGGRIVTAVTRWLWLVGVVAGPFVIWRFGGILFLYIWLLFLWETYKKFFRDRGKGETYAVQGVYRARIDPSLPSWYVAGGDHVRELPFTAYCQREGEQHIIEFWWDALAFKGQLSMDRPCLIDRVLLTKLKGPDDDREVSFTVRMEGRLYESKSYYEVPLGVRIRIGLMYGALLAVLFYMVWSIGDMGLLNPGMKI